MKYVLIFVLLALTSCASERGTLLYYEPAPTTLTIKDNHDSVIYAHKPVKGKICVYTDRLGAGYTVQVGKHIDTICGNTIGLGARVSTKAETAKVTW